MVLATIGAALTVVMVATLTSSVAFTSLTRGTADVVVEAPDAPAEIPTEVGDLVAAAQAEALSAGQSAYTLEEGEKVLVEATEALPEVVVEEVKSELTKAVIAKSSGEQAQNLADQVSDSTGKSVILVFQETNSDGILTWTHTKVKGIEPFADPSQDLVITLLNTWISAQDVPESFEIIGHD